jgi:hypothetical protein
MEPSREHLESSGAKYSLICAGFGVLVAALMTTVLLGLFAGTGLHDIVFDPYFRSPIAAALLSLAVSAWLSGKLAGRSIARIGLFSFGTWVVGVVLALSCLVISVSAAFATHFFVSRDQLGSCNDYIIGPALGIIYFGFIPAVFLGLAFSAMIRSEGSTSPRT